MNLFYFVLIEAITFIIGIPVIKTCIFKYKRYNFINKLQIQEILKQNLINKHKKLNLETGLKFSVNLYNVVQKTFIIFLFIKLYKDLTNKSKKITFLNFI